MTKYEEFERRNRRNENIFFGIVALFLMAAFGGLVYLLNNPW